MIWRIVRWGIGGFLLAALAIAGWLYVNLTRTIDVARYARTDAVPADKASGVTVTFLGTTTLLFDDGETQIMTDGFFSRPDPAQLFLRKIASKLDIIDQVIARARMDRLAALVVLHSHYDHAMDVAAVSNRTGAVVVGSESTANVARGGDVPEGRIRTPALGEALQFGQFKVTLLPSRHAPSGYPNGTIDAPLRQPARAPEYKLGAAYAVLVEHGGRSALVNGSAGFEPGALAGRHAETVLLGIGGLGTQSPRYMDDYWQNVVAAVGARHVVAIHWDNFAFPLSQPLKPLPMPLDNMDASMAFLDEKGRLGKISVKLPHGWQVFDPFNP